MAQTVPYIEPTIARVGNVDLMYDSFGDPADPPMLLIMGLGGQLIDWDNEFCTQLAEHGFWVIRFDNRDSGLSTKFDHLPVPNIQLLVLAQAFRRTVRVPYLLRDMADDAVGLLDALGITSAHIVGISMGGMIAQEIAIRHPERLFSLTSIMSTTGARGLPGPQRAARSILLRRAPEDRASYIESAVPRWRVLGGSIIPLGDEHARQRAAAAFDRGRSAAGAGRQLAAIIASGSRREALRSLHIPTLVLHGDADPLVPVANGIDTAKAIPGAKLHIIKGMGHALPRVVWSEVVDAIVQHAADVQSFSPTATLNSP